MSIQVRPLLVQAMLLVYLVPVSLAGEEPPQNENDETTQAAVAEYLRGDDVLQDRPITVEVTNGVVTLEGSVTTLYERERAAQVASMFKGVRAVINTTTVDGERRPEAELTADVIAAFAGDPATQAHEIDVMSVDGTVTLTGTVDSYAEKQLVMQVAKDVRGVRQLRDELTVIPQHRRSDEEIDAEVTRRLEADIWVDQGLVRVFVDDGDVTLRGVVGTLAQRDAAEIDAWVAGVKSVDVSELEVDWRSFDKARRSNKFAARAKYQIKAALADALRHDARVNRFAIDFDVNEGIVTLTGQVENLAAKHAAEQDAMNTVGVTRVDNQLQAVMQDSRRDEDIHNDVRSALRRDVYLAPLKIGATVMSGVVVLAGEVDSSHLKERATQVATRVKGVVDVDNQIEVEVEDQETIVTDQQLKYGIKNRMFWSGWFDSREITILVSDRVVTLTGEVDSQAAFKEATKFAIEAGATKVHNRLIIRDVVAEPK